MQVLYKYKDKLFEDIRDIVYSNRLRIDFQTLVEEYLPFQIFVTGKTMFKGVSIEPSVKYDSSFQGGKFDFSNGVDSYLQRYGLPEDYASAVSGGIDSSALAMEMKPKTIYSGFYGEEGFSELEYSKMVAEEIGADHLTYELTEKDFLDNVEESIEAVCTPAGGPGSVMEYALLKKLLKDKKVKAIVFGNGGDEIFLGYFFNQFIRHFAEMGSPDYMPNFAPAQRRIIKNALDSLIITSISRSTAIRTPIAGVMQKELAEERDVIDKLLFMNINWVLPMMLHLVGQSCRSVGIRAYNPLANKNFIEMAYSMNVAPTDFTKELLRKNLPGPIAKNRVKQGFPMPIESWSEFNEMLKEAYSSFVLRGLVSLPLFQGYDRLSWGVFQAEKFIRRFNV